ncbi:NADPH:quinone reductase-like Zn-dependent oxidoreductase [Pullulanibacillus pueri]|uniref:NADPH:quinone reductase n=1 Tax=Pullulanibacillus pueri TaxID=1437324 RepID=A0A8J2ZXP2_9BACL|nr:NADP-dependent oxidoreductase [Pullulanibacillus pueri]MBM7683202.1 NADPH:quinone reductase-like Zn-dependent oxidoreductase [Pullulanibacillus pueri]GGH85588.1 NADPH:quinone reductase [Pullulanibacillus pueri]
MKAVVINAYGGREELKAIEFPKPMPREHEVLIEVYATSINPIDWKLREGYLKERLPFKFPIILGWDAAGIIKKVGAKVTEFEEGDKVFTRPATTERGTYAEYITADASLVAHMPKESSFIEAAAVPLAGLTAWQCLVDFAEIKKGDRVLVHAGAGGVGSMAIQIAKAFGAEVIATGSSKSQSIIKKLGADHMINYMTTPLTEAIDEVDIVLDTIGGDSQEKSFEVLKPGGVLVSIVQPPSQERAKEKGVKAGLVWLEPNGEQLATLAKMIEEDELKPLIAEVLPFSEDGLKKAHELSETHHAKGKIVIEVKKEEDK